MTKKKLIILGSGGLFVVLAALLWFALPEETPMGAGTDAAAKQETAGKEKKIKYWVAPMDPAYIRDGPGKSPMGMDLVPVYEDDEGEASAEGVVKIDPVTVQNIGVRTTEVTKGPLVAAIRTVGNVTYDEERVEHIHTKISGYVEELYVDTAGQAVRRGQKLLSIYSPELVATQEEYLQALRYAKKTAGSRFQDVTQGGDTLLEATRRRLLLMDIDSDQIKALEERGTVRKTMVLRSPARGVVIEKKVLGGMKVSPGMKLYTIADLSRVWVIGSVYEYELPFIRKGQRAEITLPYEPGVTYKGRITFIYPYLSAKTRTVQVRMEFRNPGMKLKPDMYTDVVIQSNVTGEALLVPTDAVIRTGIRNIVITALGGGKFLPKEVILGREGQGMVQIKSGLTEGETVVVSGQFLIDSESNLRQAVNKMIAERKAAAAQEKAGVSGGTAGAAPEKAIAGITVAMTEKQKRLMAEVLDAYIQVHRALISDSVAEVKSKSRNLSALVKNLEESDQKRKLKKLTGPLNTSLKGLLSGNMEKAKKSFALLSSTMVGYVKGTGREKALAEALKVYVCPMNKEHWVQRGTVIENPYLGKDMLACGTEEKY